MADLDELLTRTSRTFALAIPQLPEPTRWEVEIAYLLFRIADTFEDATRWPAERRCEALAAFERLLDPSYAHEAGRYADAWRRDPPLEHEGYVDLLGATPTVLEALGELAAPAQQIIRNHVTRTARGMARYARHDGDLDLGSVQELRDYCYVVAGIVGEMLTELFVLARPSLERVSDYLIERARWFGEGLQLTNILKDADGDAKEGRRFLPGDGRRARVFELARADLRLAEEYVGALERAGAPPGLIAFNAMPVLLAWETLDRVEAEGPGAKVPRTEVARMRVALQDALVAGESVMARVRADGAET
jgi:farnesyl-diphosphate farnesyltransferase